jgi:hypothetical protein
MTVRRPNDAPVTVNIVIESELFIFLYAATSKDTHAVVASNGPLGHITIWRTAVIQKSADASSFGCINVLFNCKKETRK